MKTLVLLVLVAAVVGFTAALRNPAPELIVQEVPSGSIFPGKFKQFTGYIDYNTTEGANLFYWFFESQGTPATDPVVLWMTGGPGCASTLALFAENGPYQVQSDLTLQLNPYSWNTFANILYVDQPVGTGFSYVNDQNGYVTDEAQVAAAMYEFLQLFFAKFPSYAALPFFVVGESYGGHYVPALSAYILKANQQGMGAVTINQKGLGIGDGWISPLVQYGSYGPYALLEGLINSYTAQQMNVTYGQCAAALQNQEWDQASYICGSLMETVLQDNPGINYYDIRKQCNGPLCYDFSNIDNFLNQQNVQQAIGVSRTWTECSDGVNEMFGVDREESFRFDIPTTLAGGYKVLVYSGDKDLICNYVGGISLLSTMRWPGRNAWLSSANVTWHVQGQTAGWAKTAAGLTWLQVHNAGHMVPMDQPKNALDMLFRLLNNKPFN